MKKTGKIHWIRKHLSCGPMFSKEDMEVRDRYYYDAYAACGQFTILNGTVFRNKVTCKTCLRIMRKNEKA